MKTVFMKKIDRALLAIVVLATLLSFSATYYSSVVLGDFEILLIDGEETE